MKCKHKKNSMINEWTDRIDEHDWILYYDGEFAYLICKNCKIKLVKV